MSKYYQIIILRDELKRISKDGPPGIYMFGTRKNDVVSLFKNLENHVDYNIILNNLKTCRFYNEKYYCLYIGIAVNESAVFDRMVL